MYPYHYDPNNFSENKNNQYESEKSNQIQPYYHNPSEPNEPKQKKKISKSGIFAIIAAALVFISGGTGVLTGLGVAGYFDTTQQISSDYSSNGSDKQSASPVSAKTDQGNTITDVVNKVKNSVVEISTEVKQFHPFYGQYVSEGAGSGVILTKDGYIVTNYHVIENSSNIKVRLHDSTSYNAQIIGVDADNDLAVLKIDATDLTPVTLADSSQIEVGQTAIAIGNPLGELGGTVTEGIISALAREVTIGNKQMTLLQTSAAINPGNSGGGLFDLQGKLVGVVNAKSAGSDIESLGFAIPSNTVYDSVKQMINNSNY